MLKELHPVLLASDIQRARSFYRDTLGLEPDEVHPGALVYHPGEGSSFEIQATDEAGATRTAQLAWRTDDLDTEMEALRARGVEFEALDVPGVKTVQGVAQVPDARTACFRDTEGNLLCLTQLTSTPTAGSRAQEAGSDRRGGRAWIPGLPPELLTGVPAV